MDQHERVKRRLGSRRHRFNEKLLRNIDGQCLDEIEVYLDALDAERAIDVPIALGAITRWGSWLSGTAPCWEYHPRLSRTVFAQVRKDHYLLFWE